MGVLEKIRDIEAGTSGTLLSSDGGILKLTCPPHTEMARTQKNKVSRPG